MTQNNCLLSEGKPGMKRAYRLLIPIGVAMVMIACSQPPMHVLQDGPIVVIDMQSLGEYPSDVAGIRLIDAFSKDVVWEVKGHDRAQLGRITLTIGDNPTLPADIRHGTYEVLKPAGKQTFTIAPSTAYIIEVWARANRPNSKRTARFVTSGSR
ncbi:MAG: hypothetical protein KIT37_06655 [Steroidobacteraceae bacterium]|nr:hypothetical protein [Steroidobacteraceae bacterium]